MQWLDRKTHIQSKVGAFVRRKRKGETKATMEKLCWSSQLLKRGRAIFFTITRKDMDAGTPILDVSMYLKCALRIYVSLDGQT